jgi:hypothetical protein
MNIRKSGEDMLRSRKAVIAGLALVLMASVLYSITPAPAVAGQGRGSNAGGKQIDPVGHGEFKVESREWDDVEDFVPNRAMAAVNPPFRPTTNAAAYNTMKQAAAIVAASRNGLGAAPNPLLPTILPVSYPGGVQADNTTVGQSLWYPPDAAGAVGFSQFVQVHNAYIRITSKTGGFIALKSLQSLMGYNAQNLFDPRVQWDPIWSRWVVTAIAFEESSTVQRHFIAVSKTGNANGPWFVYNTNTRAFTESGALWDYAGLGLDQDGIIITANVFGVGGFLGAYTFALSKAQAYAGRAQGFTVFGGLAATLQPPITTIGDVNGYAWLAAAPNGSGTIQMYAMRDSSRPNATTLSGPYPVAGVLAYAVPPNAPQSCAGSPLIDTLDNRFVNSGSQVFDRYYQVHTVADAGFASVRYYVIGGLSTFAPALIEVGQLFSSATSFDFNPSIAANAAHDLVMTWSRSDSSTLPQMRIVGRTSGSPPLGGTGGGQLTVGASTSCITSNGSPSRWGDYSQVSVDTTAQTTPATKKFWWTNELAAGGTWITRYGNSHF